MNTGEANLGSQVHDEVREHTELIARRAAQEILPGMYVNLGIGIPTLCANYLDPTKGVTL